MPRQRAAARPETPAPAAPAVHTSNRSRATVIVACKLAVARFELQLCREATIREQTQAGPRDIKQFFKTGKTWIVRGTAYPEGTPPKGYIKRPEEVQGYVLTRGIPKDFWDAWVEQYGESEMVKNGLIYACDVEDDIDAIASDHIKVKDSFAPLNMDDGDARIPRPINNSVSTIEKMNV
jgi:hypothetical protein